MLWWVEGSTQMIALLRHADAVLRGATSARRALSRLVLLLLVFGLFYGTVMGCYGGLTGDRVRQPIFSAVKVPMLLLVTFGLSLPSFYVLNLLLGVGADFAEVLRALVASQAILTIVLASLAPFTVLWYISFADHDAAILFNAAIFAVASFTAQWTLRRYYRPLVARNPRHRWLLRLWLVIYAFVGIQLGWVLRPFIGHPSLPTTFFRPDSWSNAYMFLIQILRGAL
jgi:hypothetical protein